MSKRQPPGAPPPPPVQRVRIRYAKRGRLRFTSHRDIARLVERAIRRAQVPIAFSAGFSPHPKVSWVGAAATGVASEAEYVELALATRVDPDQLARALDDSLPPGIDVVEAVEGRPGTSLPDRIQASRWEVRLPGVDVDALSRAVTAFLASEVVEVERLTKDGRRTLDARAPVVALAAASPVGEDRCATLALVLRHVTPAVRPDDVLSGLRAVGALETPVPPSATRLAQGPLGENGEVGDPLAPDREPGEQAGQDGATRQDAARDEAVGGAPVAAQPVGLV